MLRRFLERMEPEWRQMVCGFALGLVFAVLVFALVFWGESR